MPKTQEILSPEQTVTLDESPALPLDYNPLFFFLSGCLGWCWLRIPGRHAAISAHASRSRMAALRGVL